MYLVHVVPIARSIGRDTLSYFSASAPEEGTIVSVPLRTRTTPAVVIGSEEAATQKSALRGSSFAIKKLATRTGGPFFLSAFIEAVRETAQWTASSIGAVLYAATPLPIVGNTKGIRTPATLEPRARESQTTSEKLVFQTDRAERYDRYRSLIREEFAKKASVFICVPTIEDGIAIHEALEKGIGKYVTFLNGSLPKKEMRARWNQAVTSSHPVCIIATGTFLSLPRADIGTFILEREGSRAYKGQARPFLDARVLAERLAEQLHARIVFAGLPLRVETLFRYQNGELDELARLKTRLPGPATSLVDMRTERGIRGDFTVIGTELAKSLRAAHHAGRNSFIFAARRGLAPTVICGDCGDTVLCRACSAGVVLHKGSGRNVFLCHACGAMRSAHETCIVCKSWKLVPLGVGTERVSEAVASILPHAPLFILDNDRVRGHAQAVKTRDAFLAAEGAVLIGTEMALSYLHKPVSVAAVASADSLLSLPEWRTHERIFSLLIGLRELAADACIIQTRKPHELLFSQAANGQLAEFYRTQIEEREQFSYPPFSTLIKFSAVGSRPTVEASMEDLSQRFRDEGFLSYAPSLHLSKGRYVMHGLIRRPRGAWPNDTLIAKIRSLPPSIAVDVEPDQLM